MVAHLSSPRRAAHRRDRHGRGLRGRLVPASAPAARTRTQAFDDMVLDAVDQAEHRLKRPLNDIEFAVEEVPPQLPAFDADVIEDGDVPLARLLQGRDTGRGRIAPRIVIYRWPLEARAGDRGELAHIVAEVILEQVAKLLGLDPEEV
ncbi:MAG: metallopeptidase family protein [Corynebacteriales bacterium]|nr:metallopeptidase family protein [Mycobacteriales bacterium]